MDVNSVPRFFSTDEGRKQFAGSAKELNMFFQTDGIDLDWEYPGIEGHPGHQWLPSDKRNFTLLVQSLRDSLGGSSFISFAAGGFKKFFDGSVEWEKVMPLLDMVNIMSYDLVHGFSTVTGHHTPLYSSQHQIESADRAVRYLDSLGVARNKMVIGSAFYGRIWENVDSVNNGLYQPGKFKSFTPFRSFSTEITPANGFHFFTDTITKSSYAYNGSKKLFATFDDESSIGRKTAYAVKEGLGGIMFWELSLDKFKGGLLHVIDSTKASLK